MADENGNSATNRFESLKADIDRRFSQGRFVAVEDDRIFADAETLRKLVEKLTAMGKSPQQMLVVQAGVDYPKSAVILAGNGGHLCDE